MKSKTFVVTTLLLAGAISCDPLPTNPQFTAETHHTVEPTSQRSEPEIPETVDYLTGKFEPAQHPDFVKIERPYTEKTDMLLRKEAMEAFKKMWQAAKAEGVHLNIISATRNFQRQKSIWEAKWKKYAASHPDPHTRALKILEYSSMPGTSRHHWGTDIDLNDLNDASFMKGGAHEKVYLWMKTHAHEYGFGQPYSAGRPTGYFEEKWHWSYLPLSKPFLKKYLTTMDDSKITGFEGASTAQKIGAVKNYVGDIDLTCQ